MLLNAPLEVSLELVLESSDLVWYSASAVMEVEGWDKRRGDEWRIHGSDLETFSLAHTRLRI